MDLVQLFFGCPEYPTAVWAGYVITPGSEKGMGIPLLLGELKLC